MTITIGGVSGAASIGDTNEVPNELWYYDKDANRLVAKVPVQTTLSSLFLEDHIRLSSTGTNLAITNLETGDYSYPVGTVIHDHRQSINRTEVGIENPSAHVFGAPIDDGSGGFEPRGAPASSGSIDFVLDTTITQDVSIYQIRVISEEPIAPEDTFEYTIYAGTDTTGRAIYFQSISNKTVSTGGDFVWEFESNSNILKGTTLHIEMLISKGGTGDNFRPLKVRPSDREPDKIYAQLFARSYELKEIAFKSDIEGIASGSEYKGSWYVDVNPNYLDSVDKANGDTYRIGSAGIANIGNGDQSLDVGDFVIWNGLSWDYYPLNITTIAQIERSSLSAYDITVDSNYNGGEETGTSLRPFTNIVDAINNAVDGSTILIKGDHIIRSEIVLPNNKSLHFYAQNNAKVGYETYNSSNGNVFYVDALNNTKSYTFNGLIIENAGSYGIRTKNTAKVVIEDCILQFNGWNGEDLNTILPSTSSRLLGYDSDPADLQAFYRSESASDGGAVRVENSILIEVIGNTVQKNLRGIRLQDCGINGAGFVTRNISSQNIESGIYLAAGSGEGCQNIIVTINSSAYNANNGLLCIGGINNKFSQNEVNGNWNAGFCAWGSANTTLRDCGLYDNNRSQYNGIGNTGDAKASIQINESYDYEGNIITLNDNARFIAEILDTQVHYTDLGSSTSKIGFLIASEVGQLANNDKNIIKVDDVGFIGQDYAVDFSEVDLTNLRVSLGDNSYQSIGIKAVNAPLLGNYNELPYSNHVMQVPEVDVVVDTLKQTIALHEGVGGNVINVYAINELQAINHGTHIDIIQRSSDKIQLRGLTLGNVYVNGNQAGVNLTSVNNTLNNAFSMNLTEFQEFIKTEVFDYTETEAPTLEGEEEVLASGTNYNSTYITAGLPDGNGDFSLISNQTGDNRGDIWSTVPMNQLGEYTQFQTDSAGGGKRFYVGFCRDDQLSTLGDGSGNGHEGLHWSLAIYDGYNAPWTFYGSNASYSYSSFFTDKQAFRDHSGILTQKVTWKVGIDENDGKFYVYFWSIIDNEWKYVAKTNYTLVQDDYHAVVRFYTNGGGMFGNFTNYRFPEPDNQAEFYYIESPDGVFHYPLFKTQAEANAVDTELGGTGTSHTHTYVDDLTGTTWYMPSTGGTMGGSSAPTDGDFIVGGQTISDVTWNIQSTDTDSNYAPTFNNITYNVQEQSSLNIQYKPQGDTNLYTISNLPTGYVDNGYAIIGTAEDITNGYGQSVTHTINVTKANDYGSVSGTITVNVLANLAGNEFTILEIPNGVNNSVKFTQNAEESILDFDTVTFQAGQTYKFYLDHASVESTDTLTFVDGNGNEYTTGVTLNGTVGDSGTYLEFAVPSDVPPLQMKWEDSVTNETVNIPMNITGSSYSETVTGITLSGPSANQYGTVMSGSGGSWITLDETISAGERLVLNATFMQSLRDEMADGTHVTLGIKDSNWSNTDNGMLDNNTPFLGDIFIRFTKSTTGTFRGAVKSNNSQAYYGATSIDTNNDFFLELTSSGNNVRAGHTAITAYDVDTTTYSDWGTGGTQGSKEQSGDQGYGLTAGEVAMHYSPTFTSEGLNTANIDWTELYEIPVPTSVAVNQTPWSKALDFSGSNEHAAQVGNSSFSNAIRMGGLGVKADAPSTLDNTKTSGDVDARPWATVIVLNSDVHNSNQHIWNMGEGVNTGSDNIYLRQSASGNLYFGWGREGSGYNECRISGALTQGKWYGVYIAHTGERLDGANATSAKLSRCFDIRLYTENNGVWDISTSFMSDGQGQRSTQTNWNSQYSRTSQRMDRSVGGSFTIGGRGANRSFRGKVASMLITTLKIGTDMPDNTEVKLMVTDPKKWENDYRVGKTVRYSNSSLNGTYNPNSTTLGYWGTQMWLMGDGTNDSYSNMIRNQVRPTDQNYTMLRLQNMRSNDIQNVSIVGLS